MLCYRSILFFIGSVLLPLYLHASAGNVSESGICSAYQQDLAIEDHHTRSTDSIAYGYGLLWKITLPDNGIGYLFGTLHSQDRNVTSLPPQARLALAQSRRLVLEVIPDKAANDAFTSAIYGDENFDLSKLIDPELYSWLETHIVDYNIPEESLPRLKPWAAFTLIGRPRPVQAITLETALMQEAERVNVPVSGLESMQELVQILDSITLNDQLTILNDTICNHSKIVRQTRDLVEMYLDRDLAAIVRFNQQPHHDETVFKHFMDAVLYDRNQRLVGRIERYLHEGHAFIAIGASHLPDEKGLLKLLEDRGYLIERVF
jgi:uncharacterized protein YbaP (TraB family)